MSFTLAELVEIATTERHYPALGTNLARLRANAGLSIERLSELALIHPGLYARIEAGERWAFDQLDVTDIKLLSLALGVDPKEIFVDSG